MKTKRIYDSKINTHNLQSPLGYAIFKAYERLSHCIEQIPLSKRTKKIIEGTGGMVSIADIIAYQIGWGRLLVGWYNAGIQGKMPIMPGDGFTTWDYTAIAQHFYAQYHYDAAKQQLVEFHTIVEKIIQITENEFQKGNLEKLGVWSWCTLKSGKQWPLSKWIQVNSIAPFNRATMCVKKFEEFYQYK